MMRRITIYVQPEPSNIFFMIGLGILVWSGFYVFLFSATFLISSFMALKFSLPFDWEMYRFLYGVCFFIGVLHGFIEWVNQSD